MNQFLTDGCLLKISSCAQVGMLSFNGIGIIALCVVSLGNPSQSSVNMNK